MIPEYLIKCAAANYVIHEHTIIGKAGTCMYSGGSHDQYRTMLQRNDLILKMDGTITGEGIVNLKISIGMPVGRHIP